MPKLRKFNRIRGRRRLFLKGLANNLVVYESIETTVPRAKEIRPMVERLVSIAKKQNLVSFRRLTAVLPKAAAEKLFYEIAPRYAKRNGGYLRIVKDNRRRKRDSVALATIEFIA
ncbi:MAG: 50S ribosomal protein L17 [Patescibacteria group bacterium]